LQFSAYIGPFTYKKTRFNIIGVQLICIQGISIL
jgi:hypothetical protein